MAIRLVRAGDQTVQPPNGLVREHVDPRPDRADEAGDRAELVPDLLVVRGADGRAQVVAELELVEPVIAAQDHEQRAAALGDHGHRLEQRPGR